MKWFGASLLSCAFAGTVLAGAASAQKLSTAEAESRARKLVAEVQTKRAEQRQAIQAETRKLLANPRVSSNPAARDQIAKLERTLLASLDRGDAELPRDLAGLLRLKTSGRAAPPIPGKQGAMTGELKTNEVLTRESQARDQAISQAQLSQLQLQDKQQYQKALTDLMHQIARQVMDMYTSLARGP